MRVWRTQKFQMQQSFQRDIKRVTGGATDDGARRRRSYIAAAGCARFGRLDSGKAFDSALDRTIARATANITLQRPRQILLLRLIQARRSDDHTRRAEA